MQFGRIHGIALAILGIVLLGVQTVYYMMPTNVMSGPTAVSQTASNSGRRTGDYETETQKARTA